MKNIKHPSRPLAPALVLDSISPRTRKNKNTEVNYGATFYGCACVRACVCVLDMDIHSQIYNVREVRQTDETIGTHFAYLVQLS
jgi:hypothetical protein